MKVGDGVPVTIAGQTVAMATVKELGDGTATLVVPATLVVMGTRTELSDLPMEESGKQVIIEGVERPAEPVVEAPAPASEVAPVVETPPIQQEIVNSEELVNETAE